MAPPTAKIPAAKAPACGDLSAFQQIPKLSEIPIESQRDPSVQAIYQQLINLYRIDIQYGNQDGKLESADVDRFLKKNPSKDPQVNACAILAQARLSATQATALKKQLMQIPDLSPVDLAPFYSLPEFKKFLELPDAVDPDQVREKIKTSEISPELKKLLLDEKAGLLDRYLNAKYFVKADKEGE